MGITKSNCPLFLRSQGQTVVIGCKSKVAERTNYPLKECSVGWVGHEGCMYKQHLTCSTVSLNRTEKGKVKTKGNEQCTQCAKRNEKKARSKEQRARIGSRERSRSKGGYSHTHSFNNPFIAGLHAVSFLEQVHPPPS